MSVKVIKVYISIYNVTGIIVKHKIDYIFKML